MQEQRVIIVHGCPSSEERALSSETRTYDKHWIPWLRRVLEIKGIKAEAPLMPRPWQADYTAWKNEFDKNKVLENDILIGHSCGCAFLVRWLGDTKQKVKKLILVAPWKIADEGSGRRAFYDYAIDKTIISRVGEIVIFTSDNEEADGKKSVQLFHDAVGGKVIELKDRGHYILEHMQTEQFPELLNEIIL